MREYSVATAQLPTFYSPLSTVVREASRCICDRKVMSQILASIPLGLFIEWFLT